MPDKKAPSVAVLNERLSTAIKLGSGFVLVTAACAVFFLTQIMDHGERLAQIQATLNRISEEQKKAVPATVGELLRNPTPGKLEATAAILETARKSRRVSDPNLLARASAKLGTQRDMQGLPEYWKAATALISYRSVIDPATNQLQSWHALKPCKDEHPQSTVAKSISPTDLTITDCLFDVASPNVPPERARVFLAGLLGNANLNSAQVFFGG